ncbi:hypothetical protein [Nitriliruptor alkaliphilus]|uniref:hypothetical protein n=1 Tax=Nitriliruptor alkaliphilus TaxID=427918 RepID=UPI000698E7EC|nr:hypothetical protein [Nitriliruptor alkaliphilus]
MSRPLTALLVVLTIVLTGCRGQDAQVLLDGASDALHAAGTSRFEMTVETVGEGSGRFEAEGAQDLTTGALRMVIDLGDDATRTETLLLGSEIFVRSPLFALFTGDEATWVRVDLEETAERQGLDGQALVGEQTGPAALLAQLDGASGDLETLGSAEVRGVDTTHLRVTVDTRAAIEQADPSVRQQLRAYAEASGLPDTYPMQLWIDDDGLVRRIRTVLDVPSGRGGEDVTQQTTLELYDFGVNVDLRAPLPEETVELTELARELERLEELDQLDAEDGS